MVRLRLNLHHCAANLETGVDMNRLLTPDFISRMSLVESIGKVTHVYGVIVESSGPDVFVGELVEITSSHQDNVIKAEVIGIKDDRVIMMLFDSAVGIRYGSEVRGTGKQITVPVGNELIGTLLGGIGQPLNGDPLNLNESYEFRSAPINPTARGLISTLLPTGVKVIDGLVPIGIGQRMGLFAGSGVGKSTLLSMIARGTHTDINVIALIGERGREVKEFIHDHLTPEVLSKSIIVVATSDESALMRKHAAQTATCIAEYFRSKGKSVSLLFDSLTRYAMALREIGLSLGEAPTARGYTSSVFSSLPKLLERAGNLESGGSITAFYTILSEGDDVNDPISDHARSILDGHIILDRRMAESGIYPAVNVLNSESRLKSRICSEQHKSLITSFKALISEYEQNKDLIGLGAYKAGGNPLLDRAVGRREVMRRFIIQDELSTELLEDTLKNLTEVVGG